MELARKQLKMEGILDDDSLISIQLKAAREWAEGYTGLAFMKQSWKGYLSSWPGEAILGRYANLLSVEAVKYLDAVGDTQTLSASNYEVILHDVPGKIRFTGENLPALKDKTLYPIWVEFTAGFSSNATEAVQQAAVPGRIVSAIQLKLAELYEGREDRVGPEMLTRSELLLHPLKNNFV